MPDTKPLRVLIADDEPLAAERLQLLLAKADGAQLVGTASDGDSAINLAEALNPDLLLLDIAMPGLDGIGVARALAAMAMQVKIDGLEQPLEYKMEELEAFN